jgi:UDP-2,3-diacylglucosamine hydrolase
MITSLMNLCGVRSNGLPKGVKSIGLVAGAGDISLLLAQAIKKKGYGLAVVAVERPEKDALQSLAKIYRRFDINQADQALKMIKEEGLRHVIMVGRIKKKRHYESGFKPDKLTQEIFDRSKDRGDDNILKAASTVLKMNGICVLSPTLFLADEVMPKGVLTQRTPTPSEEEDIRFGVQMAKCVGRLDIGQCVIVKNKTVLVVEAMAGTDKAIQHLKELGIEGAVIVKLSKPQQDLRLDMPVVGLDSVEHAIDAKCSVLAVEAGKALMISKDDAIQKANAADLCVVGVS